MDKIFRSRTVAPCRLHCNRGILPEDVIKGVSQISRELEIRRCKKSGIENILAKLIGCNYGGIYSKEAIRLTLRVGVQTSEQMQQKLVDVLDEFTARANEAPVDTPHIKEN